MKEKGSHSIVKQIEELKTMLECIQQHGLRDNKEELAPLYLGWVRKLQVGINQAEAWLMAQGYRPDGSMKGDAGDSTIPLHG